MLAKNRTQLYNHALLVVLTLTALLVIPEIVIRLAVPDEVFWPVSNIYRKSDVAGLHYTYRPDYTGLAFGVDLETNSLGFRGPEWTRQPAPGVFRIACIGDSHTFGYGVTYEDTFCHRLAEILSREHGRPVEALNFGVNGYNARQLRALTRNVVVDFEPALYLFVIANNDYKPNLVADEEGWLYWDHGYAANAKIEDGSLQRLVEPAGMPWYLEHSRALLYLKLLDRKRQLQQEAQAVRLDRQGEVEEDWMGDFPPGDGTVSERLVESVYEPLLDMISVARKRERPAVIATVCTSLDYRQMFRQISEKHGIPVVELLALFPEATSWDDLLAKFGLGWDPHLNEKAHGRWARALAAVIAETGDLDP